MRTLLLLLLSTAILLGCSKEKTAAVTPEYLEYDFKVGEQVNVSHYVIQGSTDGLTWKELGTISANANLSEHYVTVVPVAELFKASDKLLTRIMSVDHDGSILYSQVDVTSK